MSRKFVTPVALPADPTAPLEAAPKQYVDAVVIEGDGPVAPAGMQAGTLYVDRLATPVIGLGGGTRGASAFAQVTASQAGVSAVVDATGLSVAWMAQPARKYRISAHAELFSSVAGDQGVVAITDATNLQKGRGLQGVLGTSVDTAVSFDPVLVETGLSGAQTRKVRVARSSGSGTLTLSAGATTPAHILVEDITFETGGGGGAPQGAPPVGTIYEYIGTTPPENCLAMMGQTVVGAQTLYPDLWSKIPTNMKSGADMLMPDTRGRVTVGYNSADARFNAIGLSSGWYDAIVPAHQHMVGNHTHNMKNHQHLTADHTHNANHAHADNWGSGWNQSHLHGGNGGTNEYIWRDGAYNTGYNGPHISVAGGGLALTYSATTNWADRDHQHIGYVPGNNFNIMYMNATHGGGLWGGYPNDNQCDYMEATHGGAVGTYTWTAQEAVTNRNLQPYVTFLKVIRVL